MNLFGIIQVSDKNILLHFLFSELHLEFLFGCLAAYFLVKNSFPKDDRIFYLGLFLLAFSIVGEKYGFSTSHNIISVGIPAALIIFGSVALEGNKNVNVPPVLILLGDASYSIYLIHGFVINNFIKVIQKIGISELLTQNSATLILLSLLSFLTVVLCGLVVYLCIEKPAVTVLRKILVKE